MIYDILVTKFVIIYWEWKQYPIFIFPDFWWVNLYYWKYKTAENTPLKMREKNKQIKIWKAKKQQSEQKITRSLSFLIKLKSL